jgi:hypothetical protein
MHDKKLASRLIATLNEISGLVSGFVNEDGRQSVDDIFLEAISLRTYLAMFLYDAVIRNPTAHTGLSLFFLESGDFSKAISLLKIELESSDDDETDERQRAMDLFRSKMAVVQSDLNECLDILNTFASRPSPMTR